MPRRRPKPPPQTSRTFLRNHMHCAVGIDFFVVPTATFKLLYVFVVLDHARRRIVHVNVTDQPCARWATQQVIEAFTYHTAPRYLHRDRDSIYGSYSKARTRGMSIEQVVSAPRLALAAIAAGIVGEHEVASDLLEILRPRLAAFRSLAVDDSSPTRG